MNFLYSDKSAKKYVESHFMESFIQDLKKSVISLTKLLKDYGINFTIIGGGARNEYGPNRITEDVDILVDIKDKDKMLDLPIGFIRDKSNGRGKVYSLHEPQTKVEVIYTGEKAGDKRGITYIDPSKVSEEHYGVPFLTLKSLIEYKLSSGIYGKRMKDFGDIQDLISYNSLPKEYAINNNFRSDLANKYEEIWDYAQGENHLTNDY